MALEPKKLPRDEPKRGRKPRMTRKRQEQIVNGFCERLGVKWKVDQDNRLFVSSRPRPGMALQWFDVKCDLKTYAERIEGTKPWLN